MKIRLECINSPNRAFFKENKLYQFEFSDGKYFLVDDCGGSSMIDNPHENKLIKLFDHGNCYFEFVVVMEK